VYDSILLVAGAARGLFGDISARAQQAGIGQADYQPWSWDMVSIKGKLYGLPYSTDTRMIYVNASHLQQAGIPTTPPKTLEEFAGIAQRLAGRVATLRIFPDAAGRMNLDLAQSAGAVLVVSQFTLHADTSRGHRPSFVRAAAPGQAERLCDAFVAALRDRDLQVATGRFGAHMDVELVNDGPVTLVLSSGEDAWPADAG